MNAEILIQEEADKFSRYLGKYERDSEGAQKFKNELAGQLMNYSAASYGVSENKSNCFALCKTV
jgi:hypothetical protein